MYLEGNRSRSEQFNSTVLTVADLDQKKGLILDMAWQAWLSLSRSMRTWARVVRQSDRPTPPCEVGRRETDRPRNARGPPNAGLSAAARSIPVFCMGDGEMLVWVDAESGLPAKIEIREHRPENRRWNFVSTSSSGMNRWMHACSRSPFPMAFKRTSSMEPPETTAGQASLRRQSELSRRRPPLPRPRARRDCLGSRRQDDHRVDARSGIGPAGGTACEGELRQWDVATGKLRWSDSRLCPREWAQSPTERLWQLSSALKCNCAMRLRAKSRGNGPPTSCFRGWRSRPTAKPWRQASASGENTADAAENCGAESSSGTSSEPPVLRTIKSDDKPVSVRQVFHRRQVPGDLCGLRRETLGRGNRRVGSHLPRASTPPISRPTAARLLVRRRVRRRTRTSAGSISTTFKMDRL